MATLIPSAWRVRPPTQCSRVGAALIRVLLGVLLVEDTGLVRGALAALLAREEDIKVATDSASTHGGIIVRALPTGRTLP